MYETFLKYKVSDVSSVAEFLDRYYKKDRYTGRGQEYAAGLLKTYEGEFKKDGYTFISHHDSVTGKVVAFYG